MLSTMTAEGIWVGHLYLHPQGTPPDGHDDAVVVPWEGEAPSARCRLGLRFLAPLAALPTAERMALKVLLAGEDREAMRLASTAIGAATAWADDASAPSPAHFQRVLLGVDQRVPALTELASLVPQLRQDGQLGVFGLPADGLMQLASALGEHGFSVRAAGVEDKVGFLAGSFEAPDQFSPAD